MDNKVILLVEDNPRDEALTLRALKKSNIVNDVVIARDGVEALDYFLGTGAHAAELPVMPQLVLLGLETAEGRRSRGTAKDTRQRTYQASSGRHLYVVQRRRRHDQELRPGRQQLRPQAS